jgi:hypothetical protein
MATLTNESKTTASLTNENYPTAGRTWNSTTTTWDDTGGTWDRDFTSNVSNEAKA